MSRYTWSVSWWEQQGWVEDLAELGVGRHQHGCGAYTGTLGQASSCYVTRGQLYTQSRQVVLVAGGAGDAGLLATTEILTGGSWRQVGALPAAVRGLRGAALHGAVFMSGARHNNECPDTI